MNGELTEEELYNKFLANFETNKLVGDNVSMNDDIKMLLLSSCNCCGQIQTKAAVRVLYRRGCPFIT